MSIKVYSAMMGEYDEPRKDDVEIFDSYNRFKHPRLNAKIYKVLPHLFLDTEWSIWVDANFTLKKTPEEMVAMCKGDINVFKHPERDCIYQEAEECKNAGLDSPEVIDGQMARYRAEGYPEHNGLGACFMVIRRHTPEINALNEKWWAEITRGSWRDQLSFPYVYRNAYYLPPPSNLKNTDHFIRTAHHKKRNYGI